MFLHVSVILFTGEGGIPACIAGGIPACLAAGLEGWYPSMPCRSPDPQPGGEVEGSGLGGVSRPTPGGGEFRGLALGGSPGPHLEGSLGVWPGGLQAHTQGGLQAHTWGVSNPTPGGYPSMH